MIDAFHCQDSRPKSYWDLPRIPELTLICPDLWHKLPFDQPFQKTATNSSSFVSATSIFWLRWPNHDSWPAVPPLSTYLNLPIPEQQPAYTLRSWKSQGTSPFALQRWLRIEPCKFRVTLRGPGLTWEHVVPLLRCMESHAMYICICVWFVHLYMHIYSVHGVYMNIYVSIICLDIWYIYLLCIHMYVSMMEYGETLPLNRPKLGITTSHPLLGYCGIWWMHIHTLWGQATQTGLQAWPHETASFVCERALITFT